MSGNVRDFRDLEVWQIARRLAVEVCKATRAFPSEERFAMGSQVRRAAVSIVANIAEGAGRQRTAEYCHHLSIAQGSAAELRALIIICVDLEYLASVQADSFHANLDSTGRMLTALLRSLRDK